MLSQYQGQSIIDSITLLVKLTSQEIILASPVKQPNILELMIKETVDGLDVISDLTVKGRLLHLTFDGPHRYHLRSTVTLFSIRYLHHL